MSTQQANPDVSLKIIAATLKGDITPCMVKFKRANEAMEGYFELGMIEHAKQMGEIAKKNFPPEEMMKDYPKEWKELKDMLDKKLEKLQEGL